MTDELSLTPGPGQVVRTRRKTERSVEVEVVDEATGRVLERHAVERDAQVRVNGAALPLPGQRQTRGAWWAG